MKDEKDQDRLMATGLYVIRDDALRQRVDLMLDMPLQEMA